MLKSFQYVQIQLSRLTVVLLSDICDNIGTHYTRKMPIISCHELFCVFH